MFSTGLALVLALAVVACAVRYVPARRACSADFINLRKARRRSIQPAREQWDKSNNRQMAYMLGAALCLIGVIFAVFIPGLDGVGKAIALIIAALAMASIGITHFRCAYKEQTA